MYMNLIEIQLEYEIQKKEKKETILHIAKPPDNKRNKRD